MNEALLAKIKKEHMGKAVYEQYQSEITAYNLDSLQKVSFIGMTGGFVLTFLSLPGIRVLDLFFGYLSIAILFTVLYTLSKTVFIKQEKLILPFYYILIILLLFLSIIMGTYWGANTNATTFVMMLIILPLFIIDRPIRLHTVCVIMSILFCLIAMRVKKAPVLSLDIGNCIVFCVLSMLFSRQTIHLKMKEIISRKMIEQKYALEVALKESEMASKAKTEFFSRMSHDMRTPMNGILGLAGLSENEDDVLQLKQNIAKMKESGEYLLDLINDTLDFQKIESGKMKLDLKVIKCSTFFQSIEDVMGRAAAEKQITFQVLNQLNPEEDAYIKLDVIRMKQILLNLLSNAIKFTPEYGKVSLQYEYSKKDEQTLQLKIAVVDSGIGMSKEYIENGLFKPFSQEYSEVTSSYKSSGLGLSITKKLIDMMSGSISVKSEKGVGTTFTIILDVEQVKEEIVTQIHSAGEQYLKTVFEILEGKRILLVEDHPLNAEIATKVLKKAGCRVVRAENGLIALEIFSASELHYFDGILMDIRMPVMDGLEAAKAIRGLNRADAGAVPILAMTANAYTEDIQNSLEAGMNEHLAKPISPNILYEALAKYMKK